MRGMKKIIKLPWRVLAVIVAAAMAGCASAPQKSAVPVDAWVLNRDWVGTPAFTNTTLKGRSGQVYSVRGGDLTNLKMVVIAWRAQKPSATYLGENVAWGKTTDS